ncbi:MAG: hypothetical protein ACXIUV_11450 [Alkalilacustris sp.]
MARSISPAALPTCRIGGRSPSISRDTSDSARRAWATSASMAMPTVKLMGYSRGL